MFKVMEECCTPKRGTKYSAYVDLFSAEDVNIGAGETKVIKLGVKLDLSDIKESFVISRPDLNPYFMEYILDKKGYEHFLKSHYLEVAIRSSLAVKGLIISNGIGIIDLDYPDEIGLIVHNPITHSWNENFEDGTVDFITHLHKGADGSDVFKIKRGDKVAQCTLKEHKGYLMGYETETLRTGGFGSTDNKVEAPIFDKPDFFRCNELN